MSENKRHFGKLAVAVSGVVASAVMLGSAAFAWYTLSTNPEIRGMQFTVGADETMLISIDEGKTFHRSVDLSDKLGEDMEIIRPVSTIDGLNWYVCDYQTGSGNIKQNEFFLLDWCDCTEKDDKGNTVHEYCSKAGFYAYTDIWVKSEGKANIRLSVPNDVDDYNKETSSGSYVLSYDLVNNTTVKLLSKGPETCARVGMLVFKETDSANPVVLGKDENGNDRDAKTVDSSLIENFFIYEPNADVRSELDKQSDKYMTDIYVSMMEIKGFDAKDLDYDESDGSYIQTYPIKGTHSADIKTSYDSTSKTYKPLSASPHVFNPLNLIVQSAAKWNALQPNSTDKTSVFSILSANDLIMNLMVNSKIERGFFNATPGTSFYDGRTANEKIEKTNDYTTTAISANSATSQVLFEMNEGKVRQIRLFFWIEGQDIDCWNDVAGMNFIARIEFATEVK